MMQEYISLPFLEYRYRERVVIHDNSLSTPVGERVDYQALQGYIGLSTTC